MAKTMEEKGMKFGTKAIHAGVKPDPTTGAIMTPALPNVNLCARWRG